MEYEHDSRLDDFENMLDPVCLKKWRTLLEEYNEYSRSLALDLEAMADDLDQDRVNSTKDEDEAYKDFRAVAEPYLKGYGFIGKIIEFIPGATAFLTGFNDSKSFTKSLHVEVQSILKNRYLRNDTYYQHLHEVVRYKTAVALTRLPTDKLDEYVDTFKGIKERIGLDVEFLMKLGRRLFSQVNNDTDFANHQLYVLNRTEWKLLEERVKEFNHSEFDPNPFIRGAIEAGYAAQAMMLCVIAHKILTLMNSNLCHDLDNFRQLMAAPDAQAQYQPSPLDLAPMDPDDPFELRKNKKDPAKSNQEAREEPQSSLSEAEGAQESSNSPQSNDASYNSYQGDAEAYKAEREAFDSNASSYSSSSQGSSLEANAEAKTEANAEAKEDSKGEANEDSSAAESAPKPSNVESSTSPSSSNEDSTAAAEAHGQKALEGSSNDSDDSDKAEQSSSSSEPLEGKVADGFNAEVASGNEVADANHVEGQSSKREAQHIPPTRLSKAVAEAEHRYVEEEEVKEVEDKPHVLPTRLSQAVAQAEAEALARKQAQEEYEAMLKAHDEALKEADAQFNSEAKADAELSDKSDKAGKALEANVEQSTKTSQCSQDDAQSSSSNEPSKADESEAKSKDDNIKGHEF